MKKIIYNQYVIVILSRPGYADVTKPALLDEGPGNG